MAATVEQAIYSLLIADAPVVALISTHGLTTADAVTLRTTVADLPAPLTVSTTYYARAVSTTTVSLHPTAGDATGNTNRENITDAGTGTHTCIPAGRKKEAFTFTADAGTDLLTSTRYRIYPMQLPQESILDAIVFGRILGNRVRSLDGPSGLGFPDIFTVSWGATHRAAKTLGVAVRQAMDGFVGTIAGWYLASILITNEVDVPEPSAGAEQKARYGIRHEWSIWHPETP